MIGIDLGLKDFAVLFERGAHSRPAVLPQGRTEAAKGATGIQPPREVQRARRLRAKHKVALVQRKTANQRKDFLHKLTTDLVVKYEGICIEDLSVKGLVRTKLAKSMTDASLGEFRRQLEYKTIWNRRHLAVIDRWYPSSKTCHVCGAVNAALTLADRSWTCVCGVCHDRDLNAALNIRTEGLKLLAAGYAERLNAHGAVVRPPQLEAVGVEL